MGKMLEPQMLPPQPIQSCQTPEQTNYKMESDVLLERHSTEQTEDELLGTGSCCCVSPDGDELDADESASASSSSLDLTQAEKVRSSINGPLSSQNVPSVSKRRTGHIEPDLTEEEHDENSVPMSDLIAEDEAQDSPDTPNNGRQSQDDDLPTLSLSASYMSDREQGDLPTSSLTISPNKIISNSASSTVKSVTSGYKSTMKTPSVTRMGKSGPGPSNGTKACAKKSFVWKYFRHPEMADGLTDRSRTQCVLCDSQLAFNASGTTTTMLNHLKSRHGDVAEQEETTRRHVRPGKGAQHSQQQHHHSTSGILAHDSFKVVENGDRSGSSSFSNRLLASGQGRISRGSLTIGQRGRPPGSNGRRTKCAKFIEATNDYLNNSVVLPNSQLKPEGNPLFPLGCYPGLTEQQQRALLTEFFSAETLTAAKDSGMLIPGTHSELQTLMAAHSITAGGDGSGLSGLGIGRTETSDMQNASSKSSLPPSTMTTVPSPAATATSTTAPTTILHRNSLLNAAAASVAAAFANGSFTGLPPLPPAPIGCCTVGPHDSSPSSSSGLGVSVTTSPLETPTTSGGSPTHSAETGRCVTSPTTVQHTPWLLGSHTKSVRNGSNQTSSQTHPALCALTESHPDSSMTNGVNTTTDRATKSNQNGFLSSPIDAASVELQSKLLALGLPFPNSGGHSGTASIPTPGAAATNEMASAFGSFINFIPPFNGFPGTSIYPAVDPFNIQQHHHHQQQQQTWLAANAWLASLANGKFLSSTTTPFGADQSSQIINSFTNGPNGSTCSMNKVLSNTSGELDRILPSFSSPFLCGSRLDQSETSGMSKTAMDGLATSCWPHLSTSTTSSTSQTPMNAYSASELLLSTAQHVASKSVHAYASDRRIPTTTIFQNLASFSRSPTDSNYTRQTQISSRSPVIQTGSLDLSQGSGNNNFLYRASGDRATDGDGDLPSCHDQLHGSLDEAHDDTAAGNAAGGATASTKRKRARPIYISPEFEPKRRVTEGLANSSSAAASAASSSSCAHEDRMLLLEDDGPMNLSSPSRSDSPAHENTQCRREHRGRVSVERQTDLATSKLTRDEFLHRLAYYLVKDLQPPEVLEGEGFRNLLHLVSDYDIPNAQEIRAQVLPSFVNSVQNRISCDLNQLIHSPKDAESSQLNTTQSPIATACAVELWPAHDPVELPSYHANLELHCSSSRSSKKIPGRVVRTAKVTNSQSLKENLQQCLQLVEHVSTNSTDTGNLSLTKNWPLPLVTNQPAVLNELIKPYPTGELKTTNSGREFIVIPCLLSELSRAVTCGLNLPEVQRLFQAVQKLRHSSTEHSTPENPQFETMRTRETSPSDCSEKKENISPTPVLESKQKEKQSHDMQQHQYIPGSHSTSITWSSAFELLKSVVEQDDANHTTRTDFDAARKLLTVLETMNQTLELIHRKDLSLTGSMIEPILQNLIEIRLAPEVNDPATNIIDSVQMFKVCVADHLSKSYLGSSELRATLQLASLLDPRFKDHVQEQKMATIKLLKAKADAISVATSSEVIAPSQHACDPSSSTGRVKSTPESSAGLETVFGLARPTLSEVDRYLREDPIDLEADPLAWWHTKATNYPRLAQLALNYLTIPLTCYATGRLKPIGSANGGQRRFDGLGLPNIVDPLGRDRSRLSEVDQSVYNLLWHNWDLIA